MDLIIQLSIGSGILAILSLTILHFVSSEFQPSWRMVSEYALGKHKWLLTCFFLFWGLSTILIAVFLWNIVSSTWASFGTAFLFLSGIGAVMGGLFDINHKLHGLAFMLGIPTFIVGTLLVGYHIIHLDAWAEAKGPVLVITHAVWISCVLMGISMGFLISGFKKAGYDTGPNATPPEKLPDGVIAFNGYANRLLILCYITWNLIIGYYYLIF